MNALRTAEIALADIDFDIRNDRHAMDRTKLKELAESIRTQGLRQPIGLFEKDGGRYVMGYGHRRVEAHRLLERTHIRAEIFPAASETEIRAARAIENLQREDITPIEEAEMLEALAATHDGDPEKVGAAIGREKRWVESRLILLRLSPRVRQILLDGDLTLKHAQLIARIPDHVRQDELAGRAAATHETIRGMPFDEPAMALSALRELVDAEQRDLTGVPWQLDAEFAGKPACTGCPHNSSNRPQLFDGDIPKKPRCLEPGCFAEKAKVASLAVRRASNTLVKETSSRTPKSAAEAAEKREATFLKPKAVLDAAERSLKPGKKTSAEKKGRARAAVDSSADVAFQAKLREWREQNGILVCTQFGKAPLRTAMYLLLQSHPAMHIASSKYGSPKRRKAAQKLIAPLFSLLKTATKDNLIKIAETVEKARADDVDNSDFEPLDYGDVHSDWLMNQLREVFGLTFPEKPKRADAAKQSEPKAAGKGKEKIKMKKVAAEPRSKKKAGKK